MSVGTMHISLRGPGGVTEVHTDAQGVARFGRLSPGTYALASNTQTINLNNELGRRVVIAVVAAGTRGTKYHFFEAWPITTLPKTINASLRIGGDGRPLDVDWGKGPQSAQSLNAL